MRRPLAVFLMISALLIGLSAGFVCHWMFERAFGSRTMALTADSSASSTTGDTSSLLITAAKVTAAFHAGDYDTFSSFISDEQGITFTPYSSVNFSTDIHFTRSEWKDAFSSASAYIWGVDPISNDPLRMTAKDFLSRFLYNCDYASAPEIGIDTVICTGNGLENVSECYPASRFVDFCFVGSEPDHHDFSSLKLVFSWESNRWMLVGIVHSQWLA